MKNSTVKSLAFIALTVSLAANAQDLKSLEEEVQNQMKVTRELSSIVQKVVEQDQQESGMTHFDYWQKKRALVSRVSAALAEYETYLSTHMDPLKPLYARHNFVANSDQYYPVQKKNLQEDVMKEIVEIVTTKIQPEKTKAYAKLLSALSPNLPLVITFSDGGHYIKSGAPDKYIDRKEWPNPIDELVLFDISRGCYSKACIKLYATDIASYLHDFITKIPSWVIINLGVRNDSKQYPRTPEKETYPRQVDITEELTTFIGSFLDSYAGYPRQRVTTIDMTPFGKDLPYPLSEQDFNSRKEELEAKVSRNAAAVDKNLNAKSTIDHALRFVRANEYNCKHFKIDGEIVSYLKTMCTFSRVPGGQFCVRDPEDLKVFSEGTFKYFRKRCPEDDSGDKANAKLIEFIKLMKW